MTRGQAQYGALAAKVKALYGKRLRLEDFQHMAAFKSEAEVLEYLRAHPSWSRASGVLSTAGWDYVGRVEVEAALWNELRLEYLSLSHFVPRQDRALMDFRVRIAEYQALLNALRRLRTGKYAKGMPPPSPIVLRGKVDYRALEAARSYDAILDAARGSIYAPTLLHLRPAPGAPLPDYTVCESLLRSAYFAHMLRIVRKQYGGDTRQVLLRSFGEQIDLLNLMHVLRLKTYFPGTAADTCLTMLYPFQYRLKPAMIHALCAAPDAAAVFALIRQTPYAASFERVEAAEVEEYYRRAFYAFNRRCLLTGPPSIYTAIAYLDLKELELQVVVNVIESVKYGVPYNENLARLVGQ